MSVKFEKTFYFQSLKKNDNIKNDNVIFNSTMGNLQFKYGDVNRKTFNLNYSDKGWMGRKVVALPSAVWSGIFKIVGHLVKVIFFGIPKAFFDKGAYLKTQGFYVLRDFQESYGNLASLFNDRYGQFHVQESQFQKFYYDSVVNQKSTQTIELKVKPNYLKDVDLITEEVTLKEKFGPTLYEKLNKKFINKIWSSGAYSSSEKEILIAAAKNVYQEKGRTLGATEWVFDIISIDYLKWFSTKQPTFSLLPENKNQLVDKTLLEDLNRLLVAFPPRVDLGPRMYGQALRVNDDHRTAFIIDMDNHTVEYFNSFGTDKTTKKPLLFLADALSRKYGVTFTYHHRTANICLQKDVYQCGIWTCKFIEERFKQGRNFDPAKLLNFDIAKYRDKVFAKAFKLNFFKDVGISRYWSYLRKSVEESHPTENVRQKARELHNAISAVIREKFIEIDTEEAYLYAAANEWINSIFIKWGKRAENATIVQALVQQVRDQAPYH